MAAPSHLQGFESLQHGYHQTTQGSRLSFHYSSKPLESPASDAIVILIHGYPESSYIWRYAVPHLSKKYKLFVPDKPGYGLSTPLKTGNDMHTAGSAIVEGLVATFGKGKDVVLIGHDRGARACHRIALSYDDFPDISIKGLVVMDIVPMEAEFAAFKDPRAAVGYFHWSFLPRTEISIPMIMAYGSSKFIRYLLDLGKGSNQKGQELFTAGGAWELYSRYFDQEDVTRATIEDYKAGAFEDEPRLIKDQEEGRKIKVPMRVVYSKANLGKQFDVQEVWRDHVDDAARLEVTGVGDGIGHFLVEEAPELVNKEIVRFLQGLV